MSAARLPWLLASLLVVAIMAWALVRARRAREASAATYLLSFVATAPLVHAALVHSGLLPDAGLRWGAPLLLLPVALALVGLSLRLGRLPTRMGDSRRGLVRALSGLALSAGFFAAAEPELGWPLDRLAVVVAVDRSRSIDLVPGAESRIAKELLLAERSMRKGDRIGVVAFGASAALEDPPRLPSRLGPPQRVSVGRDGTDIEAALRRALAELPSDAAGKIVLVTDGVETRGDALAAAALAVASDVPVDVVVLDQGAQANLRVVTVRAPTRVDQDEPMDLRVVTQSSRTTDIQIRVRRDGVLLREASATVQKGEDVVRVREIAPSAGLHRYDVEVTAVDRAADASPEDNVGSAFVRVKGATLALLLEGDAGKSAPLARALEASGFRTLERGPSGVPGDIGELAAFDLVVLSDVRASDLSRTQIDALASYARDLGGGLLLMGGDRSLGPGGYARTALEQVSPLSFDLKQQQRRASLAEVIAIDYSGSMGMMVDGQTKLALANEAAARSASLLGPGDRLGVEHVDTIVAWTQPLGPVVDAEGIAAKIRGVGVGGGGIYTDLALRAAYEALTKEEVNLRHVLLFADGGDAEQIAGCRALVKAARDRGITTSVISLGRGSDTPELEVLAKIGEGRFYLIDDATKLPAVFTQETILASRSAISEKPFRVALSGSGPSTQGIAFEGAPELRGYVVAAPKPRASVLLSGPEGDPVLATWAVGLGRAAAFTSDYKDRWGTAWLRWPGAARLMGQLGRDTARKADDPRVRLETDTASGTLHVRADVIGDDGRAQAFRRLKIRVGGPDGFSREVALDAVGAGRYSADVPLSRPGSYVTTAVDEISGQVLATTGAALGVGEELRPTGSDRVLLERIATLTGGTVRDTLAGLYDRREARRFAYTPLTHLLVLVAGLALLASVAARRLGVPDALVALSRRLESRSELRRSRKEERALARQEAARQRDEAHRTLLARKEKAVPRGPARTVALLDASRAKPPAPEPQKDAPLTNTPPPGPTLSAAERLAQRRRERK